MKLLFAADKGWSGLTDSKNFVTGLTLSQASTEKVFLLPFQNSLVLNNQAEIILSDAVGRNGVIHVINQILVPSHMQDIPLKKVFASHCHSQSRGFSTVTVRYINNPSHKKTSNTLQT